MQKISQFTNPFFWVESVVPNTDTIVDIPFLKELSRELNLFGIKFDTFGEYFEVLEYLQEHGLLILTFLPNNTILMRKTY